MKITVGHLVIVAGVGTFVVLGPMGGFGRLDKMRGTAAPGKEVQSAVPESPSRETASSQPTDNKPTLPFEERLPAGEVEPKDAKAADPINVAPVTPPAPVEAAPPVSPKVAVPLEAAPAPKRAHRRRAKSSASAQSAAKATGAPSGLVGTYVTLKLANGREVKGALVEQSATLYKIELPGLGAMSYPVRDVVSVAPAQ